MLISFHWQITRPVKAVLLNGPESVGAPGLAAVAGWMSIALSVATLLLLAALHFLSPEFAPSWRMVSEYALGRYGWALSLLFVLWGASTWALALAMWSYITTTACRIGLWFLLAAGLGEMLASIFDIRHDIGHTVAGLLGVGGLPIAALLITPNLQRVAAASAMRRALRWSAHLTWISVVLLIATLILMTMQFIHANGGKLPTQAPASLPVGVIGLDGWADRFIVVSFCIWTAFAAWQTRLLNSARPSVP